MTDPDLITDTAVAVAKRWQGRRASIFLEEAMGFYLHVFGRDETVKRLRSDAQHIEENA